MAGHEGAAERPRLLTASRAGARAAPLLAVALLISAGCEPEDRRPGTWLRGEVAEAPIGDWSFVNDHPEVQVETHPWYGIPHSVTTVIAASNNKVFVPSIYDAPAAFPGSKYWNRVIADNPAVRIRIGGQLYEMYARPVSDPEEFQEGLAALAEKYDFWRQVRGADNPDLSFVIIRMYPASD